LSKASPTTRPSKPRKARAGTAGAPARKAPDTALELQRLTYEQAMLSERLERLTSRFEAETFALKGRIRTLEATSKRFPSLKSTLGTIRARTSLRSIRSVIRYVARHPAIRPIPRYFLRVFRPDIRELDRQTFSLTVPHGWTKAIRTKSSAPYPPPVEGRVLMSLHSSLPMHRAGYSYRSHALLKELRALDRDVICFTRPGFPGDIRKFADQAPEEGFPERDTVDDVDYRRLDSSARFARWGAPLVDYLGGYAEALQLAIKQERPQIVHTASNFVNPVAGYLAARDAGIPFIHEVRGFWELSQASKNPGGTLDQVAAEGGRMEAEAAAMADRVLTLNGPMKDELVNRGVDPSRIVIVPNGVDPEPSRRCRAIANSPRRSISMTFPPSAMWDPS